MCQELMCLYGCEAIRRKSYSHPHLSTRKYYNMRCGYIRYEYKGYEYIRYEHMTGVTLWNQAK